MRRALGVIVAALALGPAPGCGDNSKACGPGTDDSDGDGECEATTMPTDGICGDGTRLDPITMECAVDPAACGGGTVLVNGRCQDPTAGLDLDLEEGPEPNAFEADATPAGLIALEPVGADGFVVHGCIRPLDDATPDLDVYLLTVGAPTLISITADGVGGLAAGFFVTRVPDGGALDSWIRYGLDLATDLSRRQVFLPDAGTYRFVMADSRTLLPRIDGGGGAVTPPAGNPDGTSCYYVTIDQLTPMPVALDAGTGDTGTIEDAVKLYTASGLGTGSITMTATISSPHARPAIVVINNGALHAFDDDGTLTFGGLAAGDTPLIVGDFVFDYAVFPAPYQLTVN